MLDGEGDCEELVCLFWVVFGYGAGMGDEIGTGNRTEEDGIGKRKETWELLNSVDRRREPSLDGVGGDDGSSRGVVVPGTSEVALNTRSN